MMLTEEEAGEKWCPLTIASSSLGKCAGSACMGWRWGRSPPVARVEGEDNTSYTGFCGQFGVPR